MCAFYDCVQRVTSQSFTFKNGALSPGRESRLTRRHVLLSLQNPELVGDAGNSRLGNVAWPQTPTWAGHVRGHAPAQAFQSSQAFETPPPEGPPSAAPCREHPNCPANPTPVFPPRPVTLLMCPPPSQMHKGNCNRLLPAALRPDSRRMPPVGPKQTRRGALRGPVGGSPLAAHRPGHPGRRGDPRGHRPALPSGPRRGRAGGSGWRFLSTSFPLFKISKNVFQNTHKTLCGSGRFLHPQEETEGAAGTDTRGRRHATRGRNGGLASKPGAEHPPPAAGEQGVPRSLQRPPVGPARALCSSSKSRHRKGKQHESNGSPPLPRPVLPARRPPDPHLTFSPKTRSSGTWSLLPPLHPPPRRKPHLRSRRNGKRRRSRNSSRAGDARPRSSPAS